MSVEIPIGTSAAPLVDACWIASHLDDPTLRVVEVDVSPAAYDDGHIPGAVLWNAYADLRHPDYTPIGSPEFQDLLGRSGIGPETSVVFYGYAAHLGYRLLTAHGHERALLLDGPRAQWEVAGRWSIEAALSQPTTYSLEGTAHGLVSRNELLELVGAPEAVLLDVRTREEYEGERFWPSGAPEVRGRPGHVPGAIHLPVTELRNDTGFRAVAELRRAVGDRGLVPYGRVVVYCTIGNRASQAWYALTHLLGFSDVGVYHGSWAEWGNDSALPVER
jgi:thiosulfate/3-mercaptopyruvate sulfurtransferase